MNMYAHIEVHMCVEKKLTAQGIKNKRNKNKMNKNHENC